MKKSIFKRYIGLWSLLAVAFLILVGISVFGPFSIFGHELKDSKIAETMTKSPYQKAKAEVVQGAADRVAESKPKARPVEVDTVPKTILFIGDSMLDGLYPRLASYADYNGHTLYCVIWYSSTSEVWGSSSKLRDYIKRFDPGYIFISLGANEMFVKDIAEKRDKYVKNILSDIGDIPYIWIGPPNWKEDTGINDLIAANVGPEHFFKTKGMKFPRMKDGAHPTHEAAIGWMDSVIRWMPTHSNHPIQMRVPSKKKSRAKRVFVHQPSEK